MLVSTFSKMKRYLLVFLLFITVCSASDSFEDYSVSIALRVLNDCSDSEDFLMCLKKIVATILDKIRSADKINISDNVLIVRAENSSVTYDDQIKMQLDTISSRSLDSRHKMVDEILKKKLLNLLGSTTLEISLPRNIENGLSEEDVVKEGRYLLNKIVMSLSML